MLKQIPPIKSADFKCQFLQNFFDRLLDMKLATHSTTLEIFLDDAKFGLVKVEDVKSVDAFEAMESKIGLDSGLKELVNTNCEIYNVYFQKLFPNLRNMNDLDTISAYLKSIDGLCASNSKLFSQMKHATYELAVNLGKAAENLRQIAGLYEQYNKESEKAYTKISLDPDPQTTETNKRVQLGFKEWAQQMSVQKSFVIQNLANFFHYRKHEYLSFPELIKASADSQEAYKKKAAVLDDKKKKLFAEKKPANWKLEVQTMKEDLNDIVSDFSKVKKYMLPQETQLVDNLHDTVVYVSKHVLFEFINFYLNSHYYSEQNFADLSDKIVASIQKEEHFWNVFSSPAVDVSSIDREGASVIKIK